MLDGWKDIEGIITACLTFLKISKNELTSHFGIEKLSKARYQEQTPGLQSLLISVHC